MLSKGKHLRHIVHFGDQQIFPGATNYVCLLFLAKAGVANCRFVKVDNLDDWLVTLTGIEAEISAKDIGKSEWNFVVGKGSDLFERLKSIPKKLEDVTSRIFQGVKTSADKIYILEEVGQTKAGVRVFCRQNEQEYTLERDLLHPLIKGGDSKAYCLTRTNRLILFPYAKQNGGDAQLISAATIRKELPLTWKFLNDHKAFLTGREDGKMDHDGWYGYVYPKALDVMPLPKIFTPDIAPVAGFSYDATGEVFFTGGAAGGYGILAIPPITPQFLMGVLNSRVSDYFHHRIATKMRGGWFSYESRFIKGLPFPDSTEAQREIIERIVASIIWLHARKAAREDSRETTGAPLIGAFFEQWVNALVYELFFPQELHAAGLHFFDLIQALKLKPLESLAEAERLPELQALFKTTYASDHKLRQALYRLSSLDLVRTIEGKA